MNRRFIAPVIATSLAFSACGGETAPAFPEQATILNELGSNDSGSYSEAASKIAKVVTEGNVTYVEVSDDVQHLDPELVFRAFDAYDSFTALKPVKNVPYAEADKNGNVVSVGEFSASIQPSGRNHIIFSIPTNIDPNPYYGHPSVFTDYLNFEETVSIIRPDSPEIVEQLLVEACQSDVNAILSQARVGEVELPDQDIDGYTLLVQETICNGIAKALTASTLGMSYDQYSNRYETNSQVPNIAYPRANGITDVYVDMPILTEEAYLRLPYLDQATLDGLIYGNLYE